MGDVISLEERRQGRSGRSRKRDIAGPPVVVVPPAARGPRRATVELFFDLTSAWTYLIAERVDRTFSDVRWTPVVADALGGGWEGAVGVDLAAAREEIEDRAAALRMPLVWPDRHPLAGRAAMRVASYAAETGHAAAFVLAASRLAFCGGFDPDDPEILAEAAGAADLPLDGALRAARDISRDGAMEAAGRRLLAQGADLLPAVRVGRTLFCGEAQLPGAIAAWRDPQFAVPC